jgi:hypothetical protein
MFVTTGQAQVVTIACIANTSTPFPGGGGTFTSFGPTPSSDGSWNAPATGPRDSQSAPIHFPLPSTHFRVRWAPSANYPTRGQMSVWPFGSMTA